MANIKQYKKGVRTQITKNFWSTEFDSKGGYEDEKWTLIDVDHVKMLQKLRDKLGASCKITSGYRSPTHNAAVGGSSRSRHKVGDATDVQFKGVSPDDVADAAEELGFDGIGRYNTFTHVDSRGSKARWDFRRK